MKNKSVKKKNFFSKLLAKIIRKLGFEIIDQSTLEIPSSKKFANEIHHNYPNHDYDDLISGVNYIIDKGFIDEKNLFVTGGSGGGVLSSWIIGKTDIFSAIIMIPF